MVDQLPTSVEDHGTTPEKELPTIYRAGLAVTSILDLPQLLHSTVESVAKLLEADVVTLYLYDQAKEDFVPPTIAVGVSQAFQRDVMPSKDGGAAKIAKKGKPIIANQAADDPEMSQGFIEAEHITSSAGFPLKAGENTVGVLFLNFHDHHMFTPEDIERVSIFANQAAIAIRDVELFRQQEAANKRLRVLRQAQRAIDSAVGLQEVLEQILSEGLRIVDTGRGSLMLIEGDNLVTKAQFGPEVDDPGHMTMTFKVGEGFAGIVATTGEAILCPDVLIDNRFKKPPQGKVIHFRSLLAVPIVSLEGTVIGVISADDPEVDHFDQTHKQLLHDMAAQFATAIEKMILVRRTRL